MYTAYYDLKMKPFQISSDVAFMWLGEKHKEALATLRYGILDNKGFLLLTGDVGTGKTTLINTLISSLYDNVIYASVPDPSLEKMDFFNYISSAFGIGSEFASKGKFLSSFSQFLNEAYENNKKVLLIIDECQLLTQELLEEIRLLSNVVTRDSNPLLNIFLVGQYEFNALIKRPENRAIAQRITLNYYIEPLTVVETGEYIRHRLKIAGTTKEIFNSVAIKAIHGFSKGFPRKINIICDHCLMSGYADEKKIINGAIVRDSAKDLQIPEHRRGESYVTESKSYVTESTTGQSVSLRSVTSEPFSDQSNQPSKAKKVPFFWSIGGIALILLASLFCSFLFLYYTNTTYKEAVSYLTSIQDKIGTDTLESPGKNIQPAIQNKKVLLNNKNDPQPLPVPDISLPVQTTSSAQRMEQTTSAKTTSAEGPKKPDETPRNINEGTKPVSPQLTKNIPAEVREKINDPLKTEQVNVQAVIIADSMTKDSTDRKLENPAFPLPEEPLIVRFKNDSNLFSVADIERMKEFAKVVREYPEVTINIFGYTDSIGDNVYNEKLSDFRANMVKSFLMGQNLPHEKMRAQGFGKQNPVDRNDTAQGRRMNRRVEISVIKKM